MTFTLEKTEIYAYPTVQGVSYTPDQPRAMPIAAAQEP